MKWGSVLSRRMKTTVNIANSMKTNKNFKKSNLLKDKLNSIIKCSIKIREVSQGVGKAFTLPSEVSIKLMTINLQDKRYTHLFACPARKIMLSEIQKLIHPIS
jgi:hypothetical protein